MSMFDTHSGYQQLVDSGVPEKQANAHVKILTTLVDERLVTRDFLRAELQEFRQEMHEQIASLRQDTHEQNASLRQDTQEQIASLRQDTQEQIASLRQDTQEQIASLRQDTQEQIASLRQEIANSARRTRYWTTTVVIVCTGILSIVIAVT